MESVRLIRPEELDQLLELYRLLHPGDPDARDHPGLLPLWEEICLNKNLFYPVVAVDGRIVSSCTLAIVPNLTRNLQSYGLIENVITHPDCRKKGYATKVLQKAVEIARDHDCYKVMLLTGQKDPATLRFYEQAGFVRGVKTGFVINL